MTSPADKLRAARDLISDPERWCQGVLARDELGDEVRYDSKSASQWCAGGAWVKLFEENEFPPELVAAAKKLSPRAYCVTSVNDATDHPTVMRMFSIAIELAEKEG